MYFIISDLKAHQSLCYSQLNKMAAVLPQKQQGTYTFASQPRAVQQRKKYRDAMGVEQ